MEEQYRIFISHGLLPAWKGTLNSSA